MKITGARVFDPANGVNGEPRDIRITGERIGGAGGGETLDARGCIAMAGALDIHAHIFGPSLLTGGAPDEWTDAAATVRRYLALGYTAWLEPGLPRAQGAAFETFARGCGMSGAWLSLEGEPSSSAGRKLFGEAGIQEFLGQTFAARPHLHLPGLAQGDGLAQMARLAEMASKLKMASHLSHVSHYAFDRSGGRLAPRGDEAARILDAHPLLTADAAPIVFGPALTFTADVELAARIAVNGGGAVKEAAASPFKAAHYEFRKERYIDALLWLAAMELILSIEDLSRLSLAIDFPSGGRVEGYPAVIAMLMERDRRAAFCAALNADAVAASSLPAIKRELALAEIAIVTRAAPRAAGGFAEQGHLGDGACADVVLYKEQTDVEKMFASPALVIRGGKVITENGAWK